MRHTTALLLALTLLPTALPTHADTDQHAISPDQIQEQQHATQLEEDRLQREAGGQALALRSGALIHDCQTEIGRKSLYPGEVSFDSVNIIEEKHVYITGKVNFPDAKGDPQPWRYECMLDTEKKAIETAKVSKVR